jgi:two-component system, LytTR family, response regulator
MYLAIIIDDEAKGRLALSEKVKQYCPTVKIVAEAANANEGMAAIARYKPDIVFLDIEMPGMDGFEMLNQLPEKKFHLIFTTAYNQYAIKAIRYAAFDYLLKPVDIDELRNAIASLALKETQHTGEQLDLLQQKIQEPKKIINKLAVPSTEGLLFFNLDEIVHLEANSNYTAIYFVGKPRILASKTLKDFEELLPTQLFFRPHHSFIINLNYIKRYIRGDGGQIEMQTGAIIDVSRRKKEEFLQLTGH